MSCRILHETTDGAPIGGEKSVAAKSRKDTFGISLLMGGPNRSLLDRRESISGRVEIVYVVRPADRPKP